MSDQMPRKKLPYPYRRAKFGVSHSLYNLILLSQRGRCAICGGLEKRKIRGKIVALSIDHNHATNEVRALLCNNCNALLGLSGEKSWLLRKAANYLDEYNV